MDSIHDLGGKLGFGEVAPTNDPVGFLERWHGAVFAMTFSSGGTAFGSGDQFRHAIERIDPVGYLTHGYYGRWLGGLETLLLESETLTSTEIEEKVRQVDSDPAPAAARPSATPDRFTEKYRDLDARRPVDTVPRFQEGQVVVTRSTPSIGHTRLPAYARGKQGTIVALHGGWVLPDASAHGNVDRGDHLYTVAFDSGELWGEAGEPGTSTRLDLFESYLHLPAQGEAHG